MIKRWQNILQTLKKTGDKTNKSQLSLCVSWWFILSLTMFVFGVLAVTHSSTGSSDQSTVFVDLKTVIHQPLTQLAQKLDKSQQVKFSQLYNAQLDKTIEAYGQQNHVNIVVATTLYNDSGIDVTQAIIKENMQAVTTALVDENKAKIN